MLKYKAYQVHCDCDVLGVYPTRQYSKHQVRVLHPDKFCFDCRESIDVDIVEVYSERDPKPINLTEIRL